MKMKRYGKAAIAAATVLASLAAAGCAARADGASAQAGFAGYKWRVTTIAHGGKPMPIPARDEVYMEFTPDGEFLANEPVNSHFGTYRQVGDTFTTSELAVSAVGYIGGNPITLLAIKAISAFDGGVSASATVNGDQMAVSVGGYLLDCQRDGRQPNFPPAPPTQPGQGAQSSPGNPGPSS